jgi:hypothetical protein
MGLRHLNCILLLGASCTTAQIYPDFASLATTEDGSQVYFATPLRLASEAILKLPNTPAIYRYFHGRVERLTVPLAPPTNGCCAQQGNAGVTADGTVVSYTDYPCDACPAIFPTSHLIVNGTFYPTPFSGQAEVSRNGQFVLNSYPYATWGASPVAELRDLQAGITYQPAVSPTSRQSLTSDGTVVGLDPRTFALSLWNPQFSRTLSLVEPTHFAIINDRRTWIVYEATTGQYLELRALEIASGRDMLLHLMSIYSLADFAPSISDDGTTILFLFGPLIGRQQAWVIHPDGTGLRQLTNFPEYVTEAVLSGNGQTVSAIVGPRIISIDVATGAVRKLVSAPPACGDSPFASLPRPCRAQPR